MAQSFLHWLRVAMVGSVLLPFVIVICSLVSADNIQQWLRIFLFAAVTVFGALIYRSLKKPFSAMEKYLELASLETSDALDRIPEKYVNAGIVITAALSLILELSIIRWQASAFEFFAFYKNFSLIACFAGLGAGYGLSHKKCVPLFLCIPLLLWQLILLTLLRTGLDINMLRSLLAMPVTEQLTMGLNIDLTPAYYLSIYFFLAVVTTLTAILLVPIGQLCGRLLSFKPKLQSYGLNLIGSLLGVLAMVGMSALWSPPAVWFGLCCAFLLVFLSFNSRLLVTSSIAAIGVVLTLCWPASFPVQRVYSPYQILEVAPSDYGWMTLRAAGQYYQRLLDLSKNSVGIHPALSNYARYYNLPYMFKQYPKSVLVVGAGTGNDVAAALRHGAKRVVAVEIDPAIISLGKSFHPERPYDDPRTVIIIDDARAYLRNSKESFDLIVFGLLDSHTTSSNAASLRLDSYVYTLESLKGARSHLNDGGVLSLSFSIGAPEMARKIYLMMRQSFDNHAPVCIGGQYDESFSFLQARHGELIASSVDLESSKFHDLTEVVAQAKVDVDVSDDDWPFFYMPRRVWPLSYFPLVLLIVGFTYLLISSLQGQRVVLRQPAYFLMGAGFMLIETKAITELCLYFGSTWTVTGITIAAILLMAFGANLAVSKLKCDRVIIPFALLLFSLGAGFWMASNGGLPLTLIGKAGEVLLVTCPIFFSGIVFSSLLKKTDDLPAALSENILGAIAGGMLEYSAMALGYRALYLLAIAVYALALVSSLRSGKRASLLANRT